MAKCVVIYISVYKYPWSTKDALKYKLKVTQAVDKQNCDKVPLIMICIDSLTAKVVHAVK